MTYKPFTVEQKTELLSHLVRLSTTWDSDVVAFFRHAREAFPALKDTTWDGRNLEVKLRREYGRWKEERQGRYERRRGHEEGSLYDRLMAQWVDAWADLYVKQWRSEDDARQARASVLKQSRASTSPGQPHHRMEFARLTVCIGQNRNLLLAEMLNTTVPSLSVWLMRPLSARQRSESQIWARQWGAYTRNHSVTRSFAS